MARYIISSSILMVIVRDASYMSPSKDEEFLHRAFSSAGFVTNVCPANREIW
jgi:hypothetical protein